MLCYTLGPPETEDDRIEREMYSNESRFSDDVLFNPRLAVYYECISELLRRGDPISIAIAHCMLQWSKIFSVNLVASTNASVISSSTPSDVSYTFLITSNIFFFSFIPRRILPVDG